MNIENTMVQPNKAIADTVLMLPYFECYVDISPIEYSSLEHQPTLVFRNTPNPAFQRNPFRALKNNLLPVFPLILHVDLPTTFIYQHLNGPAEWPVPFAKASPPK